MKKVFFVAALSASVLMACNNKKTQSADNENAPVVEQTTPQAEQVSPAELLNVSNTVEGYDKGKHEFTVIEDGTYTITMESDNLGSTCVLHDADGNDVVSEIGESWTGELKKGTYTVVAGLMRNAARKPNAKITYTVVVKK